MKDLLLIHQHQFGVTVYRVKSEKEYPIYLHGGDEPTEVTEEDQKILDKLGIDFQSHKHDTIHCEELDKEATNIDEL